MRFKRIFPVIALFFVIIFGLSGCGALYTMQASSKELDKEPGVKESGKNDVTRKEFRDDRFLVETAKRYGLMALFAETVYRRELVANSREITGCKYLEPGWPSEDVNFGMPKLPGAIEGWERWVPTDKSVQPCLTHKNGLFYETYVYRDASGKIIEAVISFRGTENSLGQIIPDWGTNFANFFGFEPPQYKTAREHLPNLIESLEKQNSSVTIYAVGHSLGGGLAQQAGYLSASVREVFTFNTSPVTNWTNLRLNGLVAQGYPIIHRIYHGGEALETPRFVANTATTARYGRHDIGLQFGERRAASGHSMKILACTFASILKDVNAVGVPHYYPTEYMATHVLKKWGDEEKEDAATVKEKRICSDTMT